MYMTMTGDALAIACQSLFVVEAELEQRRHPRPHGFIGAGDQICHRGIDVGAIGMHLVEAGARDQPPLRARVPCAHRLVVRIEEKAEALVEAHVAASMRLEQESLEKPSRVREMPFGWARVGHRLDDLVLGAQRRRQVNAGPANRRIAVQPVFALRM
jgi:hypothetical protein